MCVCVCVFHMYVCGPESAGILISRPLRRAALSLGDQGPRELNRGNDKPCKNTSGPHVCLFAIRWNVEIFFFSSMGISV